MLLGGCALLEPHQHVNSLLVPPEDINSRADEVSGSVASVFRDIRRQQLRYRQAITEHSLVGTTAPFLAAGLAASSLALGGIGAGSEALRYGLGAGAAGVLGGASLLQNRARQMVYLNGIRALECVIASESPFFIRPADLAALNDTFDRLEAATTRLERARDQERRIGTVWSNDQLDILLRRARAAAGSRGEVHARLDGAALRLRQKAVEIISAVDADLIRAERDTARVQQLVSSVAGLPPGLVAGGPPAEGAPRTGVPAFSGGQNAVDSAAEAMLAELPVLERSAARLLAAVPRGTRACLAPLTPNILLVLPDEPVLRVNALPRRLTFMVRGGVGDRQVALLGGAPADAVSHTQSVTPAGGHQIVIDLRPNAAGSAPRLIVADASGLPPIEIALELPPTTQDSPTLRSTPRGGSRPASVRTERTEARPRREEPPASIVSAEWTVIREVLGLASTSAENLSALDVTKLRSFADQRGLRFEGVITSSLLEAIMREGQARAAAATLDPARYPLEVAIASTRRIREACRLPAIKEGDGEAAGIFDAAMRRKLFAMQRAASRSDVVTADIRQNIVIHGRFDEWTRALFVRGRNQLPC